MTQETIQLSLYVSKTSKETTQPGEGGRGYLTVATQVEPE